MKTKSTQYQPKTGQPCHCKRGMQRDNCAACEGTGWLIDFAAIRARAMMEAAKEAAAQKVPWVETDLETAYGKTCRMQRSIRVF